MFKWYGALLLLTFAWPLLVVLVFLCIGLAAGSDGDCDCNCDCNSSDCCRDCDCSRPRFLEERDLIRLTLKVSTHPSARFQPRAA